MKREWHISEKNWVEGIKQLHKITYSQKRYHSKALIEKGTPLSFFSFYGEVGTQSFLISPVVFGINRMVVVISGNIKAGETGAILFIKVAIAPFIRNFVFAVYLWFSISLCAAMIFAKHITERYIIAASIIAVAVFLALWMLLVRQIIKKQSISPLETLAEIFCPACQE